MADLLTVTAPLLLRMPDGKKYLMAEKFAHPRGLLFFEPFWNESPSDTTVHLIEGEIRGSGPWKIGEAVVTLLNCGERELSMEWTRWREYLAMSGDEDSLRARMHQIARDRGAEF